MSNLHVWICPLCGSRVVSQVSATLSTPASPSDAEIEGALRIHVKRHDALEWLQALRATEAKVSRLEAELEERIRA